MIQHHIHAPSMDRINHVLPILDGTIMHIEESKIDRL